jgi:hypothetical protein
MPGVNKVPVDLGTVTEHEVGHWFGLLHVSQGANWEIDTDMIADTPRQLTPLQDPGLVLPGWQCPGGKGSCPFHPGLDSIHDYMDYVANVCQTEFTTGQTLHANTVYKTKREGRGI